MRLLYAYGAVHALCGGLLLACAGLLLPATTLGVTRQPLPLVWPLAVLHVAVAQLPLRDLLPAEGIAERARLARTARTALALAALTAGAVTYVHRSGSPTLADFFVLLAAVGFAVSALTGGESWPITLGTGMAVVGMQFISPWQLMTRVSEALPTGLVFASLGLAMTGYVTVTRARPGR